MTPGRGSDSLRAVLLSARTGSGSGSKQASSAVSPVTWHSLMSGVKDKDPPGHYFPSKLAMSTGLIKIFFSILMVGLGSLTLLMNAPLSSLGAGIWVGIVVGVSGFLGVCAARRPYAPVYVISFMSVSILSMAASGILVVLSATSWAKGNQIKELVLYDKETQSEIDFFGKVIVNNPSILASGFLVVLGVLDILISLASVALSAKEACGTNSSNMGVFTIHEGHDKKERLYKWLGQQKNIFQMGSSPTTEKKVKVPAQFVVSTGERSAKRKIKRPLTTHSTEPLLRPVLINQRHKGEDLSSSNSSGTKKQSSSGNNNNNSSTGLYREMAPPAPTGGKLCKPSALYSLPITTEQIPYFIGPSIYANPPLYKHHQLEIYDFYTPGGYHSLPCPQHPYGLPQPPLYYVPHNVHYRGGVEMPVVDHRKTIQTNLKDAEKRKRRLKRRDEREKKRNLPLTDEQIENSYTGLDREIAEGFISLTMEPATSRRKKNDQRSY